MKNLKKIFIICTVVFALLLCMTQSVFAASISVTAGQSSVKVGNTVAFTITVPSNTQAWTYQVAWSDNLTYVSGDTEPMGFEGNSTRNQLIFKANGEGTGKVWIAGGSYSIDRQPYDASGSATVSIVSA